MIVYHLHGQTGRFTVFLSYFIFNVIFITFFYLKEFCVPKFTDKGRMVQIYTNFNFKF